MQVLTKTVQGYKYSELSESAKEKALQGMYDINTDNEWYDFVYDDAKAIGALMGIDIDKIYFSGFSSQGDGACFEGSYAYKKGSIKAVRQYAPQDAEILRIAKALADIQKRHFYRLSATVKQSGHYSHEYCTSIELNEDYCFSDETNDAIEELLRDFMRWIYKQLNAQYDYLTSRKAIEETIEANDYDFTENGDFPAI